MLLRRYLAGFLCHGKKVLKVNENYYMADHGLREAVVGANLQNVEIVLENIGGQ